MNVQINGTVIVINARRVIGMQRKLVECMVFQECVSLQMYKVILFVNT